MRASSRTEGRTAWGSWHAPTVMRTRAASGAGGSTAPGSLPGTMAACTAGVLWMVKPAAWEHRWGAAVGVGRGLHALLPRVLSHDVVRCSLFVGGGGEGWGRGDLTVNCCYNFCCHTLLLRLLHHTTQRNTTLHYGNICRCCCWRAGELVGCLTGWLSCEWIGG
jgi:hypothetical protein